MGQLCDGMTSSIVSSIEILVLTASAIICSINVIVSKANIYKSLKWFNIDIVCRSLD